MDAYEHSEGRVVPPPPPVLKGGVGAPPVPVPQVRSVPPGLPGGGVPPPPPVLAGVVPPPEPGGVGIGSPEADNGGGGADAPERLSKVPSVPELFEDETPGQDGGSGERKETAGPEIVFEPLHVLDPLCIKWGFGVGVVRRERKQTAEPPNPVPVQGTPGTPAPVFLSSPPSHVPVPSEHGAGYMRLMGLLPSGSLWECTLPYTEMSRPGGMVIGRDPSCSQVVLPGVSISRRHTLVEYIDNRVTVTDMASTNGTFVNGHRLAPDEQRVAVDDGTILTLGEISLRVELMQNSPIFTPT